MNKGWRQIYEELVAHAIASYPNEACGIVVDCGEGLTLLRETDSNAADNYALAAKTVLKANRLGQIVSFYHSHPDTPARPSMQDLDVMQVGNTPLWPHVSWFIVSINGGQCVDIKEYIWNSRRLRFSAKTVSINDESIE